jgi:hypothetical protein
VKRTRSIGAVIRARKAGLPTGLSDKVTSLQPRIKMGSQEVDCIIQSCKNLEDVTALAQYAILYKNLGWSPLALDAHSGACLKVDFDQPHPTWLNSLMDLALKKTSVSLAIRLEPDSRLFVLMVNPAFGQEYLDGLGEWRSSCVARAGDIWENHFLVLPHTWSFSPRQEADDEDAPLSLMGPGSIVAVPPSVDPSSQEGWHWLQPNCGQPPGLPTRSLLLLLEESGYISRQNPISPADLPAWEDIFPRICQSGTLLQALLASAANRDVYYRTILHEALRAGFRDPRMLCALLWHAPQGEMRQDPEGPRKLSLWVEEIERLLSAQAPKGADLSLGGEPGWVSPPQAASFPGSAPGTPGLGERPGSPVTASSPDNLRHELDLLATLASKLEQQVDELERQQVSAATDPGGSDSPGLSSQSNGNEMEKLRRALNEFLLKNQDLIDLK